MAEQAFPNASNGSGAGKTPVGLNDLLGVEIIVDCRGWFFYAGRLEAHDELWLVLADCDFHDHRESNSTREKYVLDIARHGIRKNRDRVLVRMDMVVSISPLSDVTKY